jgi:hypothetical protein
MDPETLSSMLLLVMVIALFSLLQSIVITDLITNTPPISTSIAKITCSRYKNNITLSHSRGPTVKTWSLYYNNTLYATGTDLSIGDTLTYPYNNNTNILFIDNFNKQTLLYGIL